MFRIPWVEVLSPLQNRRASLQFFKYQFFVQLDHATTSSKCYPTLTTLFRTYEA